MKKIIHGILMVAAMAYAVSMNAQTAPSTTAAEPAPTADEIVGKYVAAIGGKDAISKVKSISTESSIAMMGGDNPSTTTLVDGVGFKNETNFNGTMIVQCFTSKGGWSVNPMAGAASPTPMPDDIYNAGKGQINVGGPLYDYAAKGNKIELFGKDGNAWKIKLTSKENVETVVPDRLNFVSGNHGQDQGQDAGSGCGHHDQAFRLPEDGRGLHGSLCHRRRPGRAIQPDRHGEKGGTEQDDRSGRI